MPRSVAVVIPARLASERLPRKVLLAETGKPLVQHVVERAVEADVGPVLVAADSPEIAEALEPFGTEVVLTSPRHPSGTDRIAEVAAGRGEQVFVNVQGDEPEIDPAVIRRLAERMQAGDVPMATAAVPLTRDVENPNRVKVVLAENGDALYFSRSVIPHDRDGDAGDGHLLHVGLYAYDREFLLTYPTLTPTAPERRERLEQLRALGHGHRIAVLTADAHAAGIDTPEQYAAFVSRHAQERHAQGSRP